MDVWIRILACLWTLLSVVFIEEVNLVNVLRTPFYRIDWNIKEAGCFPHGCDKSAAHHGLAIMVLSRVLPTILLDDCHGIRQGHISFARFHSELSDVESLRAKMEIDCLGEENICSVLIKFFKNWENNWNQCLWQYPRPVVIWCIDPAVQEVVIAIRKSLNFMEVLNGCSFVEFFSHLLAKRQMSHMKIAVLGILHPLFEKCTLNAMNRPVPRVLTLNNVQIAFHSQGHNGVSRMWSSSVHYHGVESIKSQHCEVITRLD